MSFKKLNWTDRFALWLVTKLGMGIRGTLQPNGHLSEDIQYRALDQNLVFQ
ncbi:MAG: hypothetical protein ABSH06_19535 [Thermodesulfobacteriota bacterium]